jgi:hypothetical protein
MQLKKGLPSKNSMIKALDPRTEEGLPLLATVAGVFAGLVFAVVVLNACAAIINWNPIFWLMSKLPDFLNRTLLAVVTMITAAGGLVCALAMVKLLHLLHGWRNKTEPTITATATPAPVTSTDSDTSNVPEE